MNHRLTAFCLGLWSLGLVEMAAARGLFGQGPGTPWFDLGTGLWIVGGLSYCFQGLLCCLDDKKAS